MKALQQNIACLTLVTFLYLILSAPVRAQEAVTVTVTGESEISFDAAKDKALRNALREAVGIVMTSETKTGDFELIRDSMYSRVAGYIRSSKVLEQRRGADDTYIVRVFAECVRGKINDDFLAIQSLIETMGRPQFIVSVEEKSGSPQGIGTWTEGAVNHHLEITGFSALHTPTRNEAVDRQYLRAVAAGDTTKANQLRLQMGAPYGVAIVAYGKTSRDAVYGNAVNMSVAELQVSVAHRDSAELLASFSVTGRGGSADASGMQLACERAVAEVFPKVLDRILEHWTHDVDVGAAIMVQVYDAPQSIGSQLVQKLRTLDGITSAEQVEWPENGIGTIRVIGRVKAADIAGKIPAWIGGYQANSEGPRLVTARPVASGSPAPTAPAPYPAPSAPNYTLPAAILGGCLLIGIILAAVIMRKR